MAEVVVDLALDRVAFERRIAGAGTTAAIVVVDLLNLAAVPDRLRLLSDVAARIAALTRAADRVTRVADERLALLLEEADERALGALAERIEEVVGAAKFSNGGSEWSVYAACGYATRAEAEEGDALLLALDRTSARAQVVSHRLFNEIPVATKSVRDIETIDEFAELTVRAAIENFHAEAVELIFDHRVWTSGVVPRPTEPEPEEILIEVGGVLRGQLRTWRASGSPPLRSSFVASVQSFLRETFERLVALDAGRRDALTGLLNRAGLRVELDRSEPRSIAILDVDRFKSINDDFGYSEGDRVLCSLALMLREHYSTGWVARWGGEEFVVASPQEPQGLLAALRRSLDVCQRTIAVGDRFISFSGGVAAVKLGGWQASLTAAEAALKISKVHRGQVTGN